MTSVAPYDFNANELLTLGIAVYAAVVSTLVLGWDAYKWLASGPKVDLTVTTGMKLFGGVIPDPKNYISVTAYNIGDRPTTITNLGGMYFDSWWRAYLTPKKFSRAFIITLPSQAQQIPYRFEVGDQWVGLAEQTDDLIQLAKDGYLFFILYTSGGSHGHRVRVKVKEIKNVGA